MCWVVEDERMAERGALDREGEELDGEGWKGKMEWVEGEEIQDEEIVIASRGDPDCNDYNKVTWLIIVMTV